MLPIKKIYWSIKKLIIDSYFHFFPSVKVLLYHSVGKVDRKNKSINVRPDVFLKHLIYIKSKYNILSVKELENVLKLKKIPKKSIVITFDDGYLNNYENVLPIISKYNIPIGIFITSSKDINSLNKLYFNKKYLILISKNNLVTIGGHTDLHNRLSELSLIKQDHDIKSNKKKLEKILESKVEYFAYPYGQKTDFNLTTKKIVKNNSYKLAFAAYYGVVNKNSDVFSLPRCNIKNWSIKELRKNIRI